MKIKLNTGIEIEVPVGLPTTGKGFRNSGAQEYLKTEAEAAKREVQMRGVHIACQKYWGDVHSVLHPFGGVGLMAQVIDQTLPHPVRHHFMERDSVCCQYLREQGRSVYQVHDSYEELLKMDLPYDLVMMDQSAATCKEPLIWQVYERLAKEPQVKHLWLNDSACSKLWLHTGSYSNFFGEEILWLSDYLRAYTRKLNVMGWVVDYVMRRDSMMYMVVNRGTAREDDPPVRIIDLRKELGTSP